MKRASSLQSTKQLKMNIKGFKFPVRIHKRMLQANLPASAWVVMLTLLSECDDRGIVRHYNMAEWAETLGINRSTLHYGFYDWLMRYTFVEDVVIKGETYIQICNYEETIETKKTKEFNYFRVSPVLFDTEIFKQLVHKRHVRGIEFLMDLFNRFRVQVGKGHKVQLNYNLDTLKWKIGKREGKDVRWYMDLIQEFFDIEVVNKHVRGTDEGKMKQVHIKGYVITIGQEHIAAPKDFAMRELLAKYRENLTHILDGIGFAHRKEHVRDMLRAFRQEVINTIGYFNNKQIEELATKVYLDSLAILEVEHKRTTIKEIGAYYRGILRRIKGKLLKDNTTPEERINALIEAHKNGEYKEVIEKMTA